MMNQSHISNSSGAISILAKLKKRPANPMSSPSVDSDGYTYRPLTDTHVDTGASVNTIITTKGIFSKSNAFK